MVMECLGPFVASHEETMTARITPAVALRSKGKVNCRDGLRYAAPCAVWRATQVRSNAAARRPAPPKRELIPGQILST
jgi:hypothetical protein